VLREELVTFPSTERTDVMNIVLSLKNLDMALRTR
jgi:hypothetical protein